VSQKRMDLEVQIHTARDHYCMYTQHQAVSTFSYCICIENSVVSRSTRVDPSKWKDHGQGGDIDAEVAVALAREMSWTK
jgi:hypothetical protein